jgi:uncharacterized protein YlxW (UPF0749 family)
MNADQRAERGSGDTPTARPAGDDATAPVDETAAAAERLPAAAPLPAGEPSADEAPPAPQQGPPAAVDVPPAPPEDSPAVDEVRPAPDDPPAPVDPSAPDDVPPAPDDVPPATATDGGGSGGVTRKRRGRDPLAAVLIGVLTLLLGFAFAVQVRSTDTDQVLAGAREEDLVRILDDLSAQQDRLRQEIADQRAALDQLGSSDSASAAALKEARQRSETLGILNGSVAAQGPGITMTISDPAGRISSSVVLNAIEELRGAGAETMQVDDVRVGVSSAVTGAPGQLSIDGHGLQAPYTFVVIGSPQDMATAMSIPGGVVSTVGGRGGSVDIVQSERVVVDALRPLDEPQYAEPDGGN